MGDSRVAGRVLQTERFGGVTVTTESWLREFFDRSPQTDQATRTPTKREMDRRRAEERLVAAGI